MTATARDPAGFAVLAERIAARGFGIASYKDGCLRRRIAVRMRATGSADYQAYAARLEGDPAEWDRLLDALTINVTRLYRNPEVWAALAETVLPAQFAQPGPLHWWSAGCSSGEEAHTLAALALEQARRAGRPADLAPRLRILGTDIDTRVLAAAALGVFDAARCDELPPAVRDRWFPEHVEEAPGRGDDPPRRRADAALRALVQVERRDLLLDAPPAGPFDLIACRNVVIYFDRPSQDALLARFRDVLRPGGILVLGKTETLLGEPRRWFEPVDARHRIFRTVA